MDEERQEVVKQEVVKEEVVKSERIPPRYLILFIVTLITTTIAGAEWMYGRFLFWGENTLSWNDFLDGFNFSIPFLLILTFHEFGHYFTAKHHNIKVSLPNYIPLWLGFLAMPSFGTMGAFIRIKEVIHSRKEYFDIGVAGPIAGFVIAVFVIYYGFTNLPEPEYIYKIHPEYEQYGLDYPDHVYDENTISIRFGNNILYWFFMNYVVEDPNLIPHPNEIIHYPYLLAGYLALFFTALNLLPIGQLDGGHVMFGLLGQKLSRKVAMVFYTGFLFYAGLGWVNPSQLMDSSMGSSGFYLLVIVSYLYLLYISLNSMIPDKRNRWLFAGVMLAVQFILTTFFDLEGYGGWLLFALLVGRFLGVYHPKVSDNRELDLSRKIIGWIAVIIFIISFSPQPFIVG